MAPAAKLQLIPAHVRDLQAGPALQASHRSRQHAHAGHAGGLFAGREQDLHADADPEIGRPGADPFTQELEPLGSEPLDQLAELTLTRYHQAVRFADDV